jgi:hypothetical protein
MLKITEATQEAFENSAIQKSLVITFPNVNIVMTNDDLVKDSLELKEAIENGKNLSFKGCIASQLKFKVADIIRDLRDEYVEVTIQAGNTEVLPLFTGYVFDQSNQNHEDVVTQITAYDIIYKINQTDITNWYNGLTFPITVKSFRNSLFTYLGVTQEDITLVNDNLSISKTIVDKAINAGDILKCICQLNARFGQIGRDGKFYYRRLVEVTEALYPSDHTYPSEETFPSAENAAYRFDEPTYKKITYEPFRTELISKVTIYDHTGAVGGSYGDGINEFSISDNPIAYGVNDMRLAASRIYTEVARLKYTPAKIDAQGIPWVECGDNVLANTMKNIVRTYNLSRTLKGIQNLFDDITASGEQFMPVHKQSIKTSVTRNQQDIQDEAKIRSLTVGQLRADMIQADTINANAINSLRGDFNTLNAREANFEVSTVQSLNATNASINYLASIAITTQNLSAQNIDASQIRTGIISADRISTNTFQGKTIQVGSLGASYGVYTSELGANKFNSRSCSWRSIKDGDGNTVIVLAGS